MHGSRSSHSEEKKQETPHDPSRAIGNHNRNGGSLRKGMKGSSKRNIC